MRLLKLGEKVMDLYSSVHTVDRQEGNTVYLSDGTWIHRTKCYPVRAQEEGEGDA